MWERAGERGINQLLPRRHQLDEVIEQAVRIVRAGAGFGVTLEAEGRLVGTVDALVGAVEQGTVRHPQIRWQCLSSTAKPWFCEVIMTVPASMF